MSSCSPAQPPVARWTLLAWSVFALAPLAYIAAVVVPASRNIAFWDELDTAIDFLIRLDAGAGWREVLERLLAVNNEHRMVTSRLLFATSYWLTGTVNFAVIGAIGNLFLVGACAILVAAQRDWVRRARLGVVLAFLMFQLEHFENFFWSGASIDHFQVVTLAVGALAALARGTGRGVVVAGVLGLLATFTLAHGVVVWPVGALLLAHQARWRQLAAWGGVTVAVALLFLAGFQFNPGHQVSDFDLGDVPNLAHYWLALLGAPLTLGDAGYAPVPGVALLVGFGIALGGGAARRQPLAVAVGMFAMIALALIAYGRVELAGPEINSRYMVLSALAWALLIHLLLELGSHPRHPFRYLLAVAPALVVFNVAANQRFAPMAETFVAARDRAVTRFQQYGADGRGISRLHPREGHADVLLRTAAERGVYTLPRSSRRVEFTAAQPSARVLHHVDDLIVNDRAATIGGWAMRRGEVSKPGQVYVVLRSATTTLYFATVTLPRPDVASAYKQPDWRLAGFRAVIQRDRLPAEDFEVGVLIKDGDHAELAMSANRLLLAPGHEARAERASSPASP